MRLLPQLSSGTHTVKFGPFVDQVDGYTPETALSITAALTRISKNEGAFSGKNESSSASHTENGWYDVTFDSTDLGTLGTFLAQFNISGALPVWERFMVVPVGVYNIWATSGNGLLTMRGLHLVADDGTIPLDIDSGPTCGGTAMRIRAQRANQTALDIESPTGTGYAVHVHVNGTAAEAVRIEAGSSGGSAVTLNAPGSGASRALMMTAAGDYTVRVENSGGNRSVSVLGGGTNAAVELLGGSAAGIGLLLKGGTGSGGTGEALRMENPGSSNNVVHVTNPSGSGTMVMIDDLGGGCSGVTVSCARTALSLLPHSAPAYGLNIEGGYNPGDGNAAVRIAGKRMSGIGTGSPAVLLLGGGDTSSPGSTGREALKAEGYGIGDGAVLDKGANGTYDLNADEIQALQSTADDIDAKTTNLPADPASETNVDAVETAVLAAIAALNDLDSAAVEAACDAALTAFDCATEANVTAVGAAVSAVGAAVAALNDLSAAEVETAVDNALSTLLPEPSAGTPATQASIKTALAWFYTVLRNQGIMDKTSGEKRFHNSSGTALAKKVVSDDGTTYTESAMQGV